jgi:prolyl-tRNA editing enzyme YbaK/EbsC (Cys-tRNA(Pro) deacylase)
MSENLSSSALRVQEALAALGFAYRVHQLPASTRTAREAAAAVGCELGQIAKTLVFRRKDSGTPILVITSGTNRVDEARLKDILGEAIVKADADAVREWTGFSIGGVPPLGHRQAIETLIDQDLLQYAEIWAAAGTPNSVFPLSPADLETMTRGRVAQVA